MKWTVMDEKGLELGESDGLNEDEALKYAQDVLMMTTAVKVVRKLSEPVIHEHSGRGV